MSFDFGALTRNLLEGGWDTIENAGKAGQAAFETDNRRLHDAAMREAKIMAKALGDEDGMAALQLLLEKTCLRSESAEERGAKTAEHYAIVKARREGQRDLLFMILDMLRFAAGEDPQPPGGDT